MRFIPLSRVTSGGQILKSSCMYFFHGRNVRGRNVHWPKCLWLKCLWLKCLSTDFRKCQNMLSRLEIKNHLKHCGHPKGVLMTNKVVISCFLPYLISEDRFF